jgi:membrane-bound serine protease (ClpP class)
MLDNLAFTLGMAALALFIPIIAARYLLPRLPRRASVVLETTMGDARVDALDVLPLKAGDAGLTTTGLRPSGKAVIGGVTYEASSRGEFIEPGSRVEVVQATGRHLIVRALKENAAEGGAA